MTSQANFHLREGKPLNYGAYVPQENGKLTWRYTDSFVHTLLIRALPEKSPPEAEVAVWVVTQAVADAFSPRLGCQNQDRLDAVRFLRNPDRYGTWLSLAGLDPDYLYVILNTLFEEPVDGLMKRIQHEVYREHAANQERRRRALKRKTGGEQDA